jgi:hypothetical protein
MSAFYAGRMSADDMNRALAHAESQRLRNLDGSTLCFMRHRRRCASLSACACLLHLPGCVLAGLPQMPQSDWARRMRAHIACLDIPAARASSLMVGFTLPCHP